ncbi:hypothetical protein NEOLEDRAFT_1130706 [Neolentinus lepideus HHB14362 ss-1]|uniref:Uncharacterized protein n=1 Tax=Neolentinus lepideus HHB14362 ss-1 TaxID=1314782 RepID=A0A165U515_9AGAM|nr:hypothetical protein NEOLEDRAFT_1130706 [Neolentinus lepideus HHB14362 ss-1]
MKTYGDTSISVSAHGALFAFVYATVFCAGLYVVLDRPDFRTRLTWSLQAAFVRSHAYVPRATGYARASELEGTSPNAISGFK